jgi:hypothetical protein
MFGALLGGTPKITPYKVNITSCINAGSHHWIMSGNTDGPITIPAMPLMLMNSSANHPKEITIDKISFNGIQFEDNMDEMVEEGMKKLILPSPIR